MEPDDARYERPCRVMLAAGAGINWLAAAILWTRRGAGEIDSEQIYAQLDMLVRLVAQALT